MVKFLLLLTISSILVITRLSCLTSSFGFGYSRNFTVLIRDLLNRIARWCAASISIYESPSAKIFLMFPFVNSSYVSRKAFYFHLGTSYGKRFSYLARAEIMVIFSSMWKASGRNLLHENSTQPSAAFVMI